MTKEEFVKKVRYSGLTGVSLTENYTLWWEKPISISDYSKDGQDVKFKKIDDAFEYVLDDGRKVADIIDTWSALPELPLDGEIIWHYKTD